MGVYKQTSVYIFLRLSVKLRNSFAYSYSRKMATKEISRDEIVCTMAAIVLLDDEVSVTSEKIVTMLKAANVEIEPYWPSLFAKATNGLDLKSVCTNISAGGGVGAPAASSGGAAATEAAEEAPAAKKEESEEEGSDDDMGFGLFD